jgi:ornithine carbamoyltransferase
MTGHLLRVGHLTGAGLSDVLDLAAEVKAGRIGSHALDGSSLACFLAAPSTWRRVVIGTAARSLGMHAVMLEAEEVEELRRDPTGDTPRVLSGFVATLLVGTLPHDALREIAQRATVPVVNACSDEHDPCQAIADLLTLRERLGDVRERVLTYVGAADRSVAHSVMAAAALSGMHVRLGCPAAHRPADALLLEAETFADLHGGSVTVLEDPSEAVTGADAVYTAAWPEGERGPHPRRSPMSPYHVDPPLMRIAKRDAVFMHPLPAHRGEEVSAFVLESGQSVVWQQAANRLPACTAAIVHATGRDRSTSDTREVPIPWP